MKHWIDVQRVSQRYRSRGNGGWQPALREVSFGIQRGESVGVVGASGSGKSTLGRLLLGLELPDEGSVTLAGQSLYTPPGLWRRSALPSGRVGAVFQDYHASVNPLMRVGDIVTEPRQIQLRASKQRPLSAPLLREQVAMLLPQVGLEVSLSDRYPHQLSGGQMQRVCIARAIASDVDFLVLDEAVSALDVVVQRQILDLLVSLRQRLGLTYLFISHDLTAVTYLCQRVLFLHQGQLIEQVDDMATLDQVHHPEARRLLTSVMAF